jgi:hypothetical protein
MGALLRRGPIDADAMAEVHPSFACRVMDGAASAAASRMSQAMPHGPLPNGIARAGVARSRLIRNAFPLPDFGATSAAGGSGYGSRLLDSQQGVP